jgi:hypothetical protein
MESDHMAVKLDKQATSYTSYTDLLPRPIPPTYDCSNYHIAPVGPQPSPLQLGKESRQRFTNVLTLCWSHLTFDTFCTCSYLVILTHKCADRSEWSEFWFRLPSVVMLVRSRPILGLMIFGNWRLSFFTSFHIYLPFPRSFRNTWRVRSLPFLPLLNCVGPWVLVLRVPGAWLQCG